jgi:hypothetical protein
MKIQTLLTLLTVLGGSSAWAQTHPGAPFGARDPHVCASRKDPAKGGPTADQAKAYFLCDSEILVRFGGNRSYLYLVAELKIEVAPNARPFNIVTDTGSNGAIDPQQPVYNIRGTYAYYQCVTPDSGGGGTYPIGKNCTRQDITKMSGLCYKDTFADWHCGTQSFNHAGEGTPGQPAPVN